MFRHSCAKHSWKLQLRGTDLLASGASTLLAEFSDRSNAASCSWGMSLSKPEVVLDVFTMAASQTIVQAVLAQRLLPTMSSMIADGLYGRRPHKHANFITEYRYLSATFATYLA